MGHGGEATGLAPGHLGSRPFSDTNALCDFGKVISNPGGLGYFVCKMWRLDQMGPTVKSIGKLLSPP